MPKDDNTVHYEGPARIYVRELSPPAVLKTLSGQNKLQRFACVSFAAKTRSTLKEHL